MSDSANRELALSLLHADSEADVVTILERQGLWEDEGSWRLYGDQDGNFSVIGNQQSRPEAALVEKVVNSVDARLMMECLKRGIDPSSADAPQTVRQAVALFVDGVGPGSETAGEIRFWSRQQQREQARQITLAVTGSTPREKGGASITVVDLGEGQRPEKMPETFLSISRANKLRIPFVQGKFNMGGTGALKFCGRQGLQLVITRRCPEIVDANGGAEPTWGFTVVRRQLPVAGAGEIRNSVYRYLAPVGSGKRPGCGTVLQFCAPSIEALPEKNRAYSRDLAWGSVLKLYEYDMKGFGSHALRRGGIRSRLELMLPGIALPVRVHECRSFRGDPNRSFDTNLLGLAARLDADRAKNLEEGYPVSAGIGVAGQSLPVELYAFRPGKADSYRSTEGILFTVNGQSQGSLSKTFFSRKRVKMGRLADSLLLVVDCSGLSVGRREDLFMNSRDRLSNGELRKAIEGELEELIAGHPGLRKLRDRRREEEIAQRLENSKPLEEVLGSILQSSPTLSRLFLQGQRLGRPHRDATKGQADNGTGRPGKFVGQKHPTYFRFAKKPEAHTLRRSVERGRRCRVKFETDVENEYLKRPSLPGRCLVEVIGGPTELEAGDIIDNLVLHDGVANWNVRLPDEVEVGDSVALQFTVTDDSLIEPFVSVVEISIVEQGQRQSGGSGRRDRRQDSWHGTDRNRKGSEAGIQLPHVVRVKEEDCIWATRGFDQETGCEVVDDSDVGKAENERDLTFYVNVSNRALQTEVKESSEDARVVEAKFVYANVLLGLALLNDPRRAGGEEPESMEESAEKRVASTTRALAPVLLPMIEYLGSLGPDEVSAGSVGDED